MKVDGTNGILQSYDYQTPTTGFTYTFAAGTQTLIMAPAGTLASGFITMPAAPADGMVITIESTQQVTALTISANAGQSLIGGTAQLLANQPLSFIYRSTNTTWYPFTGGAGRATQVCSGTAVASTSGTAIDFTGIPSWVKRITVMFSGVSTTGGSGLLIQLGAGTVATTGYSSQRGYMISNTSYSAGATSSSGFLFDQASASDNKMGHLIITNLSPNIWVASGTLASPSTFEMGWSGGNVTLSGTLDRVRITTVNGTDTFDAGSINILYE